MSSRKILVVDDEALVRKLIRNCLELDGYDVDEADSMETAYAALAKQNYDLVTLDTVMGSGSDLQHIQRIKAGNNVLVMVVTGKCDVIDCVVGLELGADDYLTKPFHARELLARIHALLRRKAFSHFDGAIAPESHLYGFDDWQLNTRTRDLSHKTRKPACLTTAEYDLLLVCLSNPQRVLSRDQLMDLIGGHSWTPLDRVIDNQIARLRRRIEVNPREPKLIKTVRGVGYMFATNVVR